MQPQQIGQSAEPPSHGRSRNDWWCRSHLTVLLSNHPSHRPLASCPCRFLRLRNRAPSRLSPFQASRQTRAARRPPTAQTCVDVKAKCGNAQDSWPPDDTQLPSCYEISWEPRHGAFRAVPGHRGRGARSRTHSRAPNFVIVSVSGRSINFPNGTRSQSRTPHPGSRRQP